MRTVQFVKNENNEVAFLSNRKTITFKLKGIISKDHLKSLRSNVIGMLQILSVNKLVMDTVDSEYQEFDFMDHERISFYKLVANKGIRTLEIIYPNKNFIKEIKNQWSVFFDRNDIQIKVIARTN